jgi:hypothetical protein
MQRPWQAKTCLDGAHSRLLWVAVLLGFLLTGGVRRAAAAQLTASLDRDTITLGEAANLSLTVEGSKTEGVPALPEIPNLQVSYRGQSSQVSFVNGQMSSTVTHNFQVSARQPGDYTIPAFSANLGGQTVTTQPLKLKVLKPGAPTPESVNSGAQLAFMKLVLPKQQLHVGESLAGELQIHFRDGLQDYGNFQLTAIPTDGFVVGNRAQAQKRRVQIGNAAYTVVPLLVALSPVKSGKLSIGPITASVVVQLPSGRRRRDPFFEQFGVGDPFGMFGEQRQLTMATEEVTVQALPLPSENTPTDFNGAVGNYSMTFTAGPTNVTTGDPITVRVQISGRGALEALALPTQAAWHDFKTYPPTTDVKLADQLGLQGTKTFEQIVVPQSSDIKELPSVSFSFFDPEAKLYRTLTQPAIKLVVRAGSGTPAPIIAAGKNPATESPAPPQQDIVPIKQRMGSLAQIGMPLAQRPWFLTMQGVPVLVWITALVWRKRADALANNPRLRRQRQVAQIVREGLNELRALAAANDSEKFFALMFRLLQEQLGERLDCPASSITEAVIDEKLRSRGVADSTATVLHELFQTCNLARYAPIKTTQELTALISKLEGAIRELQEVRT